MATNFCYCIGGTGARVAEVAAHLCAANMVNSGDLIEFIVVDKDFDCKGTENAENTIGKISGLSDPHGIMERSSAKFNVQAPAQELCKMDMRKLNWSFTKAMEMLKTQPVANLSIKETLCTNDEDKCLLNALYSEDEQKQNTDKGFYGHPSIGALIFNYMIKNAKWNPDEGAGDIAGPVINYLATPTNEAKVFIIGSIFGGTGASIFSNLAKYIRKSAVKGGCNNRLFMSGCLLLPYFNFPAPEVGSDLKVDSNDFYIKSKVALKQYGLDPTLVKTGNATDYTFDTLYTLGQEPLHITSDVHCDGGQGQCNHFDLVDLLAADAMVKFFNADNANLNPAANNNSSNIFEYRLSNAVTPGAVLNVPVDFSMLPGLEKPIKAMLVFSGFVISEVYADILFRPKVYDVNILKAMYRPGFFDGGSARIAHFTDIRDQVKPVITEIYNYCSTYVRLANDLSKIGCSWDGVTPSMQASYNLISSGYMDNLCLVCNYIEVASAGALSPDQLRAVVDATNALHTLIPFDSASFNLDDVVQYLRQLCDQGVVWKGVAGADYAKRAADYIHEAYKFISANV